MAPGAGAGQVSEGLCQARGGRPHPAGHHGGGPQGGPGGRGDRPPQALPPPALQAPPRILPARPRVGGFLGRGRVWRGRHGPEPVHPARTGIPAAAHREGRRPGARKDARKPVRRRGRGRRGQGQGVHRLRQALESALRAPGSEKGAGGRGRGRGRRRRGRRGARARHRVARRRRRAGGMRGSCPLVPAGSAAHEPRQPRRNEAARLAFQGSPTSFRATPVELSVRRNGGLKCGSCTLRREPRGEVAVGVCSPAG
mmetsp:Transcript_16956/g.56906  ORF Transcript_16956/g.56906 Transcript_16956/m.56906 type:complete len:255 (+) Transcript_16956:630-1394(+)